MNAALRNGLLLLVALAVGLGAHASSPVRAAAQTPAPLLMIDVVTCPLDYAGADVTNDCGSVRLPTIAANWIFAAGGVRKRMDPVNLDVVFALDPNGPGEIRVSIIDPTGVPIPMPVVSCQNFDGPGAAVGTRTALGEAAGEVIVGVSPPNHGSAFCEFYFVPTGAQLTPLTVFAIGCDADPGRVGDPDDGAFPPAGCAPMPGVTLIATTGDARPLGSCVAEANGRCELTVPVGEVILREDPGTVPAGYEPIANPVLLRATQAPPGIVNVRDGVLSRPAGSASLTIHSRVCPLEYAGADYDADCHGTPPDSAQTVFLIGEHGGPDAHSGQVDRSGNVVFTGLADESYTVIAGQSRLVDRTVVFCARAEAPGVEYPSTTVATAWTAKTIVSLDAGAAIVCDLYVIPADRING